MDNTYYLVDAYGNEIGIVEGDGSFDVAFWSLIVVDTTPLSPPSICNTSSLSHSPSSNNTPRPQILLNITAHPEIITPIAALVGDICMSIKTKLGIVSVLVATKDDPATLERIPVPELSALSEILHGSNRIQMYAPCFTR